MPPASRTRDAAASSQRVHRSQAPLAGQVCVIDSTLLQTPWACQRRRGRLHRASRQLALARAARPQGNGGRSPVRSTPLPLAFPQALEGLCCLRRAAWMCCHGQLALGEFRGRRQPPGNRPAATRPTDDLMPHSRWLPGPREALRRQLSPISEPRRPVRPGSQSCQGHGAHQALPCSPLPAHARPRSGCTAAGGRRAGGAHLEVVGPERGDCRSAGAPPLPQQLRRRASRRRRPPPLPPTPRGGP